MKAVQEDVLMERESPIDDLMALWLTNSFALQFLVHCDRLSVEEHKILMATMEEYMADFMDPRKSIDEFGKALSGRRFEGLIDELQKGNSDKA